MLKNTAVEGLKLDVRIASNQFFKLKYMAKIRPMAGNANTNRQVTHNFVN